MKFGTPDKTGSGRIALRRDRRRIGHDGAWHSTLKRGLLGAVKSLALSAAVMLATTSPAATNQLATGAAPKSLVVLARDTSAVKGLDVDAAKVHALVSVGIRAVTGKGDDAAAWRSLVSSNDVVGIKIATQAAPLLATRRAVVDAIAEGLRAAGVPATNIIVWGRDATQMRAAGFGETAPAYRVLAVLSDTGWDENAYYESSLVGKLIWGDLMFGKVDERLHTRSHYPKLLTRTVTKLINVPVLQDHEACGLWGCLYNLSLGAVDNTRRFESFGQRGDPMIPEIFGAALVRDKVVLHVLDALIGGFAGGPMYQPQYTLRPGALLFSRDPVAVDAIILEWLETKRRAANVPAIGPTGSHVMTAAKFGLGQAERARIDLVEVAP